MFDTHGNLYITVGELDSGVAPTDLGRLEGKILRIRPEVSGYSIPEDNPHRDDPNALPEIYASGFRNPYRMTQRADGLRVVGDVGQKTWEEINFLEPGGNYGWPSREAPCPVGQVDPCQRDDSLNGPAIWYVHEEANGNPSGGSVTGLAYYEGTEFPEIYDGDLFHGDYHYGFIRATDPFGWHVKEFATNVGAIVALEYHDEKLYYLDVRGSLNVIYFTNSENNVPIASISAEITQGQPPLPVTSPANATAPAILCGWRNK